MNKRNACVCLEFDPLNKQRNYQYMAKNLAGEFVVGWIVVKCPWYSNEADWDFCIVKNKYVGGGICGGAVDAGLEFVSVDRNTIEPYSQIASIKYNQSIGMDTKIVDKIDPFNEEKIVAYIGTGDKIPYELWKQVNLKEEC